MQYLENNTAVARYQRLFIKAWYKKNTILRVITEELLTD